MAVPTHYYKVVLGEIKPQFGGAAKTAVGAFVMPNAPIEADMPLLAYAVPISALEEVAGGWLREKKQCRQRTTSLLYFLALAWSGLL
jgi:DNA/RNA endonuclease G (NUC1)